MDKVIELARQAGFVVNDDGAQHQPLCVFHTYHMVDELLEKFYTLARADLEAENARLLKRCGDLQRDTVLTIRDLEEANAKLLAFGC